MHRRNSVCTIQKPITKLRRSPRFLQRDQPFTDDHPKTPNLECRRSRGSYSDLTHLSSFQKGSLKKSQKLRRGEVSEKGKEAHLKPKNSTTLSAENLRLKNGVSKDTHCLRRSPRFSGDCIVKEIDSEESKKDYLSKSQEQRRGEVPEKGKETHSRPKSSRKSSTEQGISSKLDGVNKNSHCLRRSSGFSEDCEGIGYEERKQDGLSKTEKVFDPRRKYDGGTSRRLTRSFVKGNGKESAIGSGNGVIGSIPSEVEDVQRMSVKQKGKAGANLSMQCLYKIEKRVTRSSTCGTEREDIKKCGSCNGEKPIKNVSFECLDKGMFSYKDEANGEMDTKSPKQCIREPVNRRKDRNSFSVDSPGGGDMKGFANEVEKNLVGMKRKRDGAREGHRIVQGWTREQELALQRAYFSTMPTPHFWKKVSKMVPGKSAQDCFDKIHSDHLTPPQAQPRSRAKATNSSLSFSASTFLISPEPTCKKLRKSKQKSFLSHKAVRGLLQKQCKVDKDNAADLFTVLEPTLDPSIRVTPNGSLFSTPECNKKTPGFLKRCLEGSSSANKKHLSRLNASCGAALTSPPVLKQVKNKALHEKYIDQLHIREAKRKAASIRATKCIQRKNYAKPNYLQRSEVVKAAKDALITDAREAIDQFQHLRNCTTNDDDVYDDFADIAEDDIENGS